RSRDTTVTRNLLEGNVIPAYPHSMTTSDVASKLVALCQEGKNFDAMQLLYADNIVSLEAAPEKNGSFETVGKPAVIQKSGEWAGAHEINSSACEGPFVANDKFGVMFDFDVTEKATGNRHKLREIAVYTVADGMIVREEFLYGVGGTDLAR
ncbi:MAG: nuclear transport factor 2 family protein, partial [Acidobacteriota bacterium]